MTFVELETGVFVPVFTNCLEVYHIHSTVLCECPPAREVSNEDKRTLLSLSRDTSGSGGEKTLQELSRVDTWAASQFRLKSLAVKDFVMRLLYDNSSQDAPHPGDSSFIILSYTWHNASWTLHPSLGCPSNHAQTDALPLTPAMWSAFLLQRLSPSEGFWCDQLCIVQEPSSHEKEVAIGAMDLLYKGARKVVVALEDIAITKLEVNALVEFSRENVDGSSNSRNKDLSQQQKDRIARAYGTIVQARWFGRAWCLHEFLVSRNHTFLIPVSGDGGDGMVTIVRLDALFLQSMASTFQECKVEFKRFVKRSLLVTPDMTHENLHRLHRFNLRLQALGMAEVFESELVKTDGSYMQMFLEIFSLGAFLMSDKLSILLNVMNSGLYYLGSKSVTKEDCYRLANVVALASGDPTALTTNGGPVHSHNKEFETQWLRWPILTDAMRPMGVRSLPKIEIDLVMTMQGLQLDMQFFCTSADAASAEYRYLSIARLLIDCRAMCKIPASEPDLWLDVLESNEVYQEIRLCYIQALACALQLGADWIIQVYLKLFANVSGAEYLMEEALKQVIKDAVDFAFRIKFDEDLGPDMRETWEENGHVNIEGDEEPSLHDEHQLPYITLVGSIGAESEEEELKRYEEEDQLSLEDHNQYWTLLRFADSLVSAGLAVTTDKCHRSAAYSDTDFTVQILRLPSADVSPFVVFAPECDQSPDSSLNFCIPEALVNEVYWSISRLWILKKYRQDGTGRSFELVSKTRLIGTVDAPEGEREEKIVIVG